MQQQLCLLPAKSSELASQWIHFLRIRVCLPNIDRNSIFRPHCMLNNWIQTLREAKSKTRAPFFSYMCVCIRTAKKRRKNERNRQHINPSKRADILWWKCSSRVFSLFRRLQPKSECRLLRERERELFCKIPKCRAADFRTRAYLSHSVLFFLISIKHCRREIFHDRYIGGGRTSSSVILSIFVCLPANLYRRLTRNVSQQRRRNKKKSADRTKLRRSLPPLCRSRYIFCRLRRSRNE
jgi:hypothetical protein